MLQSAALRVKKNYLRYFDLNPYRSHPERREKINLHLYFHSCLWCLKRFCEDLKGFHKTF